jgi:small-conductance mechanosensitive channel
MKDTELRASSRRGRFLSILLVIVVLVTATVATAIFMPYWWAPLPAISLLGLASWRRHYLWAPMLGGLAGFLLWVVEMAILPQTPLSRLETAVAGIEGMSTFAISYLGPLLFGITAALAATTIGGLHRVLGLFGRKRTVPD